MTTTSVVQIKLDDDKCGITSESGPAYTFRDPVGNQVTISMRGLLRCLSIAEAEKKLPELPAEFWAAAKQYQ